MISGCLLVEVFWSCPIRRRMSGRPKTHLRDNFVLSNLGTPWDPSGGAVRTGLVLDYSAFLVLTDIM